ncbi:SCP2 sterol-binding domain-containing protein [Haloterrigena alkaliphila]|uniref:SCP2 sterol-binding domain-containing protein n=1 Tax=Haloterrigena alkaliphila TaxID=2816475 RepID=A0A8A2VP16_9EURY|nr:SCP2 sterol-binding domain-containing protein [Haloterrigena alkaliphila]QSW99858.1 SCP2 sterol-binding domain-containing protein [Haloterrigena alkaliphila]
MSTQQLRPIEQYFPTEPWLQEYRDAINDDDDYAENCAGWGVDFDGRFVFQIEDVPLESHTVADLPQEIVEATDDRLSALSEDEIETVLETAPDEIRESIESRDGSLEERVAEEIKSTTMAEIPDRTWPELRAELPDLLDELIVQLEENVTDDGTVYSYLDLYDGECREVDTIIDLDNQEYGFRLIGDYEKWTKLVRGEGDVIDMLMSGEFEIDGDMQKILQYSDAAVDLAEISGDVDSRFIF